MTSNTIDRYLYCAIISSYIVLWSQVNNERCAESLKDEYVLRRLSRTYFWQAFHTDWLSICL